jgi:Icc-related predicted phosphoesterase
MKIVFISDTHGLHGSMTHPIPDGDVLVHCGDVSNVGRHDQILDFLAWFASFPHKHKVFIAGNHDFGLEVKHAQVEDALANLPEGVHYLQDSGVEIEGVKFWGMPWTPRFYNWAFMTWTKEEAIEKASMIPEDTEILVSHGPPFGVLDLVSYGGYCVGCSELAMRTGILQDTLKVHAFGHIHEEYGTEVDNTGILHINASICNLRYNPSNAPIVVERTVEDNQIRYKLL